MPSVRPLVPLLVLASAARVARADAPIGVEATAETAPDTSNEVPPLLRFEPGFELSLESFAEEVTSLQLSPDAELHLRGTWREVPNDRWRDHDRIRMWSAGAGGSYNFGWARIAGEASYEHAENELGRGRSVNLELGISRTFRITDDVTGFVSLSLGLRRWLGNKPLPGEASAGQFTLSAGLRWR